MKYGYLRVSTEQQDEENQKSGIMRWLDYMQYTVDEWVIEHGVSGKKDYKKRLLGKLMEKLKQDDWLIVSEFTRLSRETFQMYEICKILVDRGVHVFSVKDNQILDLSADGKFRLAMYCYFAEKERERCSERTKELFLDSDEIIDGNNKRDIDDILGEAFFKQEKVDGFDEKLEVAYASIRQDLVQKMFNLL